MSPAPEIEGAVAAVREALRTGELPYEEPQPGRFVVTLPGERKQQTTCSLVAGPHSVSINAFVVRRPDENHEAFYRWLLQRNQRIYGLAFALDRLGDVYLVGRIPVHAVTPDEIDRVLGSVLEQADGSFNTLLELGFSEAIRKEWAWRLERGESTRNLDAFRHLRDSPGSAISNVDTRT